MDTIAAGTWEYNIPFAVLTILAIAVLIVFSASIVVFFMTIWKYITSWGNDAKIKEAANSIRHLATWIVFTIVFLFAMPLAFKAAKIKWYEYYSAKNIFTRAWELAQSLLDVENFTVGSAETSKVFKSTETVPTYSPDTSL